MNTGTGTPKALQHADREPRSLRHYHDGLQRSPAHLQCLLQQLLDIW